MQNLYEQLKSVSQSRLPPVEKWNPPLSGTMDMLIKRDGSWWHEESEIKRSKLVRLFAGIIKLEGSDYFLVSPVEKWKIHVEDVPFIVVSMAIKQGSEASVVFETNVGDVFELNKEHPLCLKNIEGTSVPYVTVRRNLLARISRSVYYELVAHGKEKSVGKESELFINSAGLEFSLGKF